MVAMMSSCKTENKSNEENDVDITNNKGRINVYYNNEEIISKEARELNSDGVELAKKNELNQAETKFIKALNISEKDKDCFAFKTIILTLFSSMQSDEKIMNRSYFNKLVD